LYGLILKFGVNLVAFPQIWPKTVNFSQKFCSNRSICVNPAPPAPLG
jgi:hypothetical protein